MPISMPEDLMPSSVSSSLKASGEADWTSSFIYASSMLAGSLTELLSDMPVPEPSSSLEAASSGAFSSGAPASGVSSLRVSAFAVAFTSVVSSLIAASSSAASSFAAASFLPAKPAAFSRTESYALDALSDALNIISLTPFASSIPPIRPKWSAIKKQRAKSTAVNAHI